MVTEGYAEMKDVIEEVIAQRMNTHTQVLQQCNGKLVDTSVESADSQAITYEKLMSNCEA